MPIGIFGAERVKPPTVAWLQHKIIMRYNVKWTRTPVKR